MKRRGGCFCGAVKYELDGHVFGARSCHCSRCRKAFSAQANSYAVIKPGSFKWLSGEDNLKKYPEEGQEGRLFCSTCGSSLCGVVDGEIHGITLGCLDDDQEIEIKAHIFVGSKASWEVLPENVPQFEQFPDDIEILTKP